MYGICVSFPQRPQRWRRLGAQCSSERPNSSSTSGRCSARRDHVHVVARLDARRPRRRDQRARPLEHAHRRARRKGNLRQRRARDRELRRHEVARAARRPAARARPPRSTVLGGGGAADSTRSSRVTHGTVAPGTSAPTTTMKNTRSNSSRAPDTCAITGNRREHDRHRTAQPHPPDVRRLAPAIAEGQRGRRTSRADARRTPRKSASVSPIAATCHSRDGNTSRPSSRNISTWLNQPSASCTRRMPTACGSAPAAEHHPGDVHGEEAAAVQQRGRARTTGTRAPA